MQPYIKCLSFNDSDEEIVTGFAASTPAVDSSNNGLQRTITLTSSPWRPLHELNDLLPPMQGPVAEQVHDGHHFLAGLIPTDPSRFPPEVQEVLARDTSKTYAVVVTTTQTFNVIPQN